MKLLRSALLVGVLVFSGQNLVAEQADALSQSGYGAYTEWIAIGAGGVTMSYNVRVSVGYEYISYNQIHIYGSSIHACFVDAANWYRNLGWIMGWTRGWYIWDDTYGDIDSDPLTGPTDGIWQPCNYYDWDGKAVTGQHHWPWPGTRVKARTQLCVTGNGNPWRCAGYRNTFTGYMW